MKKSGSYDKDINANGNARLEIIADSRSLNEFELSVGNINDDTVIQQNFNSFFFWFFCRSSQSIQIYYIHTQRNPRNSLFEFM